MNIENMQKVRDTMAANPEKINMGCFMASINGPSPKVMGDLFKSSDRQACIGGFALAIFHPRMKVKDAASWVVMAAQDLGLTADQGHHLFMGLWAERRKVEPQWCPACNGYHPIASGLSSIKPREVIAYLDQLLAKARAGEKAPESMSLSAPDPEPAIVSFRQMVESITRAQYQQFAQQSYAQQSYTQFRPRLRMTELQDA